MIASSNTSVLTLKRSFDFIHYPAQISCCSQQQTFKLRSWAMIFVFQLIAIFVCELQLVETSPVSVKSIDFGLAYFYRVTIGLALLWFLSFFSIVIVIYSIKNTPTSAGFSLETSYVRRLEGREAYAAGTLIAYLIGMLANGIGPYLAFLAG